MTQQTITFITDWHISDYYLGALKGSIIKRCNQPLSFIDICHQIPQYQYKDAAFALQNSYHHFPKNTIHVVTINIKNTNPIPFIATHFNNHFFITPDSGIMDLITQNINYKAVLITPSETHHPTFPELDYIPEAIYQINNTNDIIDLGKPHKFRDIKHIRPTKDNNNTLGGIIISIDSYGNAITNITQKTFEQVSSGRAFTIMVKGKDRGLEKIHSGYEEASNELVAVFNSTKLLEIAHMNYPAYKSLGLLKGDLIKIVFK